MMMQGEAYSWIGVLAVAPVVMVLTAWFLVLLHGYKTKWGSVDVFLTGLFSQQLVTVLLCFLWTVLELVHPTIAAELCGTLLWAFISIRTLHLATLASLAVDRTLTIMWPYRYRLSVRKSQVKYHLFVLTLLATLVGVAAVFARKEGALPCSFLPHTLETKFSIFSICLQSLLLLVTMGCTIVVQCHVCTLPDTIIGQAPSDLAPLGGTSGSNTSTTSSSVSRLQQRPQSVIADDFRGTTLSVISLFCSMLDYLPHIAMTVLDEFWRQYLPPWSLENLSVWIYVGEGLLVPVLAALADPSLNTSLKKALSKDPNRSSQYQTHSGLRHSTDDSRFRVYPRDLQDVKFPITNGSLVSSFVPTINSNSRLPQYNPNYPRKSNPATRLGVTNRDVKGLNQPKPPLYMYSQQEQDKTHKDHIYATLSETYGSNSTLEEGFLSDEPCNSLTTVANDDFVFHNVRPSAMQQQQKQQRPRNLKENTTQTTPKSNNRKKNTNRQSYEKQEQECIRELIFRLHNTNAGFDNPGFENDSLGTNKNNAIKVYKIPRSQNEKPPIIPSLSLNAIDSIDDANMELPAKSESNLSLHQKQRPKKEGERYVRRGKKGAKRGTGGVNSLVGRMQRGNSIVSMQSLFTQLDGRGTAVSDTGEFLPVHSSSSLPDFKTIFISDYI